VLRLVATFGFYQSRAKIDGHNIGWQLENWSNNKNNTIELISKETDIKGIIGKIENTFLNITIN
jgi:hypothetical protein